MGHRYLVDDLWFALRLLGTVVVGRVVRWTD